MKENLIRTPLWDKHRENGAEMGEFMGCLLPVHYGDAAA